MGGYIGPSAIVTQVDGYNRTQTDALISPTNISDKDNSSTGAFDLPSGTTAQRPASPNTGYTRYNTTIGSLETWNGSAWVTSGGLLMQAVQTTSFTAAAGNSYPVNTTSGAITVTLPASPTGGQQVNVFDYAGTAATNIITINQNGGKINGVAGSASISSVRASVTLVYVDSTQGWVDVAVGNASYIPLAYSASYLVIAGGGGGGTRYGGGGAGGYRCSVTGEMSGGGNSAESPITVQPGSVLTITVGAGGAGGTVVNAAGRGSNGGASAFSTIASSGGGGGAPDSGSVGSLAEERGSPGGCGGGGSGEGQGNGAVAGGAGTSGQGYAGGYGWSQSGNNGGGGGGGAGAAGGDAGGANGYGAGGVGVQSSIDGTATYRAGGGGATAQAGGIANGGSGGGGKKGVNSGNGSTNTGGGGASGLDAQAGNGGSGIVIIRYAGTQRGTGGTVTSSGGYTIHTFTSSGTFTA